MTKKKEILLGSLAVLALALIYVLYRFNYLPHPKYTNEKFGIETYRSQVDRDGDGVDDQTDILQSVRAYLATRPKYKSKYYATGYPDDGYGVCTDVVAFGLLGAGYDLMELVHEDVLAHGDRYDIDPVDENIDFRRVRNLKVFFRYNATALTTDIYDIGQWQGGDIVIFENHIGIVSDKRNGKGDLCAAQRQPLTAFLRGGYFGAPGRPGGALSDELTHILYGGADYEEREEAAVSEQGILGRAVGGLGGADGILRFGVRGRACGSGNADAAVCGLRAGDIYLSGAALEGEMTALGGYIFYDGRDLNGEHSQGGTGGRAAAGGDLRVLCGENGHFL